MLKQNLGQKQLQKLSPQQIQLMKLLQVPTASLEQRVKEELEINPALDEGKDEEDDFLNDGKEEEEPEAAADDFNIEDYISDDDYEVGSYNLSSNNYRDPDDNKTLPIAVETTFHDFLEEQLGMVNLSVREKKIARQLIGSIDDDGYLRRELDAIVDDLSFSQNVESNVHEVEDVLMVIQTFEPGGVGARGLQECLMLQITKKNLRADHTVSQEVAEDILENHFEEFTKKHYEKLGRQLGLNEMQLKEAIDEIRKLNPKPGSGFSSSTKVENYVIPDFIITNDEGNLKLTLNSKNAPDLKISDSYVDMLRDYNKGTKKNKKQKEAVLFIKQKIDAAKWFIDAIKQRQQTMLNTMRTIMQYQYEYFQTGDETKLRPMILKDIAEATSLDISTISRVANSKYVQTEFGTFQLKSFFSESLQTDSGEEVSTREVKKILKDLIADEDKRRPLSDQKLTKALVDKGYNIARRTVAKYREQLSIPVARLRKEL